ncbi:chloride channel CLIC-like protein 1 isoform X2 [Xenopus laevis]|uniref:Chloride channel CLIC-like protein 1 n=1 Tax=Xenopus laevis TaxID=8355 RepID=A0A8J1MYJ5_XENLA|nr:chloride channel CLIC-like protein 1 isoform X2 [Xenopus laevis]
MLLFLLLALYLLPVNGDNTDEWIDHSDMLNYDAASGKMKTKPQDATQLPTQKANEEHQNVDMTGSANYQECKKTLENLSVQPDDSYPKAHYDAEAVLTVEMLAEIQSFLNDGDWNVGALDDALSSTLVQFKRHNEEEWKWKFEDHFGVDVYTFFILILCLLCLAMFIATEIWTHIGWFIQLKRLFILSTVISFGWNWIYLYKVAFAEHQAELAKLQDFDKCGQKISWSESLFDWMKGAATFQNDPCEDYFKALIVSPTLMVPPTKALALTFTNYVTEPLKHIGKGIGEFLNALLSEIPLFFQVPVLIFIAVLLLAFFYGAGTAVMNPMNHFRRLPGPDGERPLLVEPSRPARNGFNEDVHVPPPQGGHHNQLPPGERGRDNEVVNMQRQRPLDDTDGSNNPPVIAFAAPANAGQVKCNNARQPFVQEEHSIKKSEQETFDVSPSTESPKAETQKQDGAGVKTMRSTVRYEMTCSYLVA